MLVVLGCVVAGPLKPAHGCLQISPFETGKPFSSEYFVEGGTVFRGVAVGYHIADSGNYAQIEFDVSATYRGENEAHRIVLWFDSPTGFPNDLESFQRDIGKDLVVVLEPVVDSAGKPLYMVMQHPCQEPAMQTFEVMEPVLRERGFIK